MNTSRRLPLVLLKKLFNILCLTTLHHFCFNIVASPSCDVVIESVYNNNNNKNGSWHAVNNTTIVLSRHEKTIWSVELYALPLNSNSANFKVKKTKSRHLKGLYLCVKNETYISLCKKDNKDKLNKCKALVLKFHEDFGNCTLSHSDVDFWLYEMYGWIFQYQIVRFCLFQLNLCTIPLKPLY